MAPIHDACKKGDVEAVRQELAAGVSLELRGPLWGSEIATPLLIAVNYESLEIVSLLLEAGADANVLITQENSWSESPLSLACLDGNLDLVTMLIAAGASASLHLEDPSANRPVEVFMSFPTDHKRILPMLLRAGSPLPRPGTLWMQENQHFFNAVGTKYANAVAAAGGYVPYERAHRKRLTDILIQKFPRLPADVLSHIVALWAHTGQY